MTERPLTRLEIVGLQSALLQQNQRVAELEDCVTRQREHLRALALDAERAAKLDAAVRDYFANDQRGLPLEFRSVLKGKGLNDG